MNLWLYVAHDQLFTCFTQHTAILLLYYTILYYYTADFEKVMNKITQIFFFKYLFKGQKYQTKKLSGSYTCNT